MQTITERNLRSVDLNLLVMFDALMAERHVTRAARHNGISQPAMSKALNRLRHLLDDPLFERRDGRMEPTPRALDLAGPIRSALSDISRTLTAPEAPNPSQFTGAVRIAAIDLHQTTLLPALTTQLRLQAPRLDLRIQVADRDRLYDQLANGEVDVAIAPILTGMPELCAEMLWRDRLVTLIGAKNRLKQPLTLEAYAAADHVVDAGHVRVAPDGRGASLVDSILAARGLRRRIAVVLPSSSAVPHVVAATDLIATLPSKIVSDLRHFRPQRDPRAPAPGRSQRPSLLASAHPELAPASVAVQSYQGDGGGPIERSPPRFARRVKRATWRRERVAS